MAMSILTDEEIQRVAEAVIKGSGEVLDNNKVIGAVQWAQLARTQAGLLGGVLAGWYLIDLRGDGPVFRRVDQKVA
jgi:hypothetical protein